MASRGPTVLTVTAFTRLLKESVESSFPAVWVGGEMSNIKRADSGHLYFSLKEGRDASLDCVMWRSSAVRLGFEPKDGLRVEAFGGITLYEPRGRYQLSVRELRPGGLGALLIAFEELKRRLQAEGLFDASRKRPLPAYPRRIGIVTSPVGAAIRDLIKVLRARWPGIGIVLAPVRVQGQGASWEIAEAIRRFGRYPDVDLLIVGRGGGSLEDLWAFNEESVVRAIATSPHPVISAVGHEVDWTLADSVADVRAATPSNAAELAVRSAHDVGRFVDALDERMRRALARGLEERRRRLGALLEKYGFRRQHDVVRLVQQRVDELLARLGGAIRDSLAAARRLVESIPQRYGLREWPRTLAARGERVRTLDGRLTNGLVRTLHAQRARSTALADRLRALSPRLVLERGYCLARAADGTLLRGIEAVTPGDLVTVEFARGEADARVETIRRNEPHAG